MGTNTELAGHSDSEFEVLEIEDGPTAAASRVASFMIGDPPTVRRGETDPDPVQIEKTLRSKAKPFAKMFQMEKDADAQAYAELEQRAMTSSEVQITKIKEITNGVKYSLFICWLEFERPVEVVRENVERVLREKRAALLASIEPAQKGSGKAKSDRDGRCNGITGKGTPCTRKARVDGYCRTHVPKPKVSVKMDAPPPTHTALGSTA